MAIRGAPFQLNGTSWPNKTKAKAHFSAMLNRYQVGQQILQGRDHDELLALVTAYDAVDPEWAGAKTGVGVAAFQKDMDDEPSRAAFATPCFYVLRTDGTRVHFSTNKAVDAVAAAQITKSAN